jgi:hypothetical protein
MFIPNQTAILLRKLAKRDIHGRENFMPGVPIRCSVVSLTDRVVTTSVRADSTASRAAADEEVLQAKLMVQVHVTIKKGDVLHIAGRRIEVAGIHQRFDILGKHDHNEVIGDIKGDL